jgi:beta-N-acetylhexosaminidase
LSSSSTPSPVVFGCSGLTLTQEERDFFTDAQPLGFILFQRNIHDKDQVKTLISDLKSTIRHTSCQILIDQEGGRVARLKEPSWTQTPSSAELAKGTIDDAKKRVYDSYLKIAQDLSELGITVDCAPVLDLDVKGASAIMGDRTFSDDPAIVSELGAIAIKALEDGGITPVMKHIPGHGPAKTDSHEELPVVNLSFKELQPHFATFKANAQCPWAMTAHIVYSGIDPYNPATQSSTIIHEVIRREIGFQRFLISDDLGMKALSGSFKDRAYKSLEAGCDAVLHCSGNMQEMIDVMKGVAPFNSSLKQQVK